MSNEVIKRAIGEVLGSSAANGYVKMSEVAGTVSMRATDLERVVARAVKLSEDERRDQAMRTYAEHVVAQGELSADEDAAAKVLAEGL